MQLFIRILSIVYVASIFLFADSSVAKDLAPFNPYSLLHIPLYAIMSLLLLLSIAPLESMGACKGNAPSRNARQDLRLYYLIVGLIALGVAIGDEYHQSFVPSRTASIGDVFLDLIGIILFLFLFSRWIRYNHRHPAKDG